MIKKEILKLTSRGQDLKQDKVIQDAVNRNEWKLRERVREFQDFEDEELLQIALDKDEVSRRKSNLRVGSSPQKIHGTIKCRRISKFYKFIKR